MDAKLKEKVNGSLFRILFRTGIESGILNRFISDGAHLWKFLLNQVDHYWYRTILLKNEDGLEKEVAEKKYFMGKALIKTIERALSENRLSEGYRHNLPKVFLNNVFQSISKRRNSIKKGLQAPAFILIDPTSLCNLNCEYCYADAGSRSKTYKGHRFSYSDLKRIIDEAAEYLGVNFFVFSGGEPTLWQDKEADKDISDIFDEYRNYLFLMFTNGTALHPDYAKKHNLPENLLERFAESGNVLPCLSQEGVETNKRRGKLDGMYLSEVVEEVSEIMVQKGVPFFYSITVTRNNAGYVGSEEFHNNNLKKGALGEWNFHALPIGRIWNKNGELDPVATMDIVITPEQRKWLFDRNWKYVIEKNVFIGDFWNAGAATVNKDCLSGCIAAARNGGHFAIRANGDITPCVFFPMVDKKAGNIHDIWSRGKTIVEATQSDLFREIRENIQKQNKNYMLPCSFKDEFIKARALYDKGLARAFDPGSEALLKDQALFTRFIDNITGCKKIMTPDGQKTEVPVDEAKVVAAKISNFSEKAGQH